MSDPACHGEDTAPAALHGYLTQACERFGAAWENGEIPSLEKFLQEAPDPIRKTLFRNLLVLDLAYRRLKGETPNLNDYRQRFPTYTELIDAARLDETASVLEVLRTDASSVQPSTLNPKEIHQASGEEPKRLGRYRILLTLGSGSYGVVYKAYDEELRREVAIKIPHRNRISSPEDIDAYLAEGRMLAGLDHPGIVPIHDVGRTPDGLCYLVSKFIEGCDLRTYLQQQRPTLAKSAEMVALIAEALHHAHQRGLVHRDIKPANILLDQRGRPYVTDFGLALPEEDVGQGATFAGTPAYMSPEQARGEGHLVDARTDVYSLGVVFYELLTGQRPFQAVERVALLTQIKTREPRPPRQIDNRIPREWDRICLKALSKRVTDRYSTALDMAEDLRHCLSSVTENQAVAPPQAHPSTASTLAAPADKVAAAESELRPIKVVPYGLRSFDSSAADFFLELLPGPRDRHGLPDSIRFWKAQVETVDPEQTFRVGLLYGPSGCGKSSLVKAGLLPRLGAHVSAVYIEATPADTEQRLLKSLRRLCPALPEQITLVDVLARLRRGRGLPEGKKVLIVLDQFEQWLHAKRDEHQTELVQALRHCDGEHVQCIVSVRDDFGMAATRFMSDLEVPILQGLNFATVDLFTVPHARKVLMEFGRAFGCLPEDLSQTSAAAQQFLDAAVAGLTRDGKVISVHLALFAEMVKNRPWTPATMREVGGTGGIGVTFLEETFGANARNPEHRLHQRAARGVLRALLPEQGTELKGHMRSHQELLEASGYARRPRDFQALFLILDTELRLVTPTDPEGSASDEEAHGPRKPAGQYYQLTHDYLVPALQQWLTRKQRETVRGRAELRLAERVSHWVVNPQNRYLPAWWEWVNIRLCTRPRDWTPVQRQMMHRAGVHHLRHALLLAIVLALLGYGIWEGVGHLRASKLVDSLASAEMEKVPEIVKELAPLRRWAEPMLHQKVANPADAYAQLRAAWALASEDDVAANLLFEHALGARLDEQKFLRTGLAKRAPTMVPRLWTHLEDGKAPPAERFRAGILLAGFDPPTDAAGLKRWSAQAEFMAQQFLASVLDNPSHYDVLLEGLRPIHEPLIDPLALAMRDPNGLGSRRMLATTILADYARDQTELLAQLLPDADTEQFEKLYPLVVANAGRAKTQLRKDLSESLPADFKVAEREAQARQHAQAAIVLLRLGEPANAWKMLDEPAGHDPTTRTFLIHYLARFGASAESLIARLNQEPGPAERRAIILSLGEFSARQWPAEERQPHIPKLLDRYRKDGDPGVHSAIDWLLRPALKGNEPRPFDWGQATALERIDREFARQPPTERLWYVNGQGQTLAIIRNPEPFVMGSPWYEPGRLSGEWLRTKRIPRSFAIGTKEVTQEQFKRFLDQNPTIEPNRVFTSSYTRTPDCPAVTVDWFMAAQYCNWLSKVEGIPESEWCYPPVENIKAGMVLYPDYLQRTGYRLPTEAEWEYACRAGARTSWFFGSSKSMLREYAWYTLTTDDEGMRPVGQLKPNDLGLFDVIGNAGEWCQSLAQNHDPWEEVRSLDWAFQKGHLLGFWAPVPPDLEPRPPSPLTLDVEEKERTVLDLAKNERAIRGGAFNDTVRNTRAATRNDDRPTAVDDRYGLRVARTYR